MAFGPAGRLYVMTTSGGVFSYTLDASGALANPINAVPSIKGIGIGFHGNSMYLSSFDGSIYKLTDDNQNGHWGETGETSVAIVTGIPQGDHNTDQIQIVGNTLYVGIGRRTINGHSGAWTSGQLDDFGGKGFFAGGIGRTWGDSAYSGTIAWIVDVTSVPNKVGAANAFNTEPPVLSQELIQGDAGPFTNRASNKLVVHSAGARNPFGLCLDRQGNLWFTNNFNRTVTLGNGQAGFGLRGDRLDANFAQDVQDQLFKAVPVPTTATPTSTGRRQPDAHGGGHGNNRVKSVTFDNLYNKGPYTIHDPANPDGLGRVLPGWLRLLVFDRPAGRAPGQCLHRAIQRDDHGVGRAPVLPDLQRRGRRRRVDRQGPADRDGVQRPRRSSWMTVTTAFSSPTIATTRSTRCSTPDG